MTISKCKKCKRVGGKIFLKGERCDTPKCPITRTSQKTSRGRGFSGSKKRKQLSEYGTQLREKQKVRFCYGVLERQFKKYINEASEKSGSDTPLHVFELLESRLDNVVFRLGLGVSRSVSRQIVSHGHIMVNGRKVNIPSYRIKIGDKISIRPQSASKGIFKDIDVRLKGYSVPLWLELDKEKIIGEVISKPSLKDEMSLESSLVSIVEFYSR